VGLTGDISTIGTWSLLSFSPLIEINMGNRDSHPHADGFATPVPGVLREQALCGRDHLTMPQYALSNPGIGFHASPGQPRAWN
jgi:hypothetical protein